MEPTINEKQLRTSLPEIVNRVRRGKRFIVLYRGRPVFRLMPITDELRAGRSPVEDDPLFQAEAVGRSTDGLIARDHHRILYESRR